MTTPTKAVYSVQARIDAHTALRDIIDSGQGNGCCLIHSDNGDELVNIELEKPCGQIDPATGKLTINHANALNVIGLDGIAAYATIRDSDLNEHLAIPVKEGTDPEIGWVVLDSISLLSGGNVQIDSIEIG